MMLLQSQGIAASCNICFDGRNSQISPSRALISDGFALTAKSTKVTDQYVEIISSIQQDICFCAK